MIWLMSSSNAGSPSDPDLEALHPLIQSLIIQDLGWRRLHPVQREAIAPILAGQRDVLIVAGTAAGKTEAAWFPVFSSLLTLPVPHLGALCVSPLKALIDDQVKRLAGYGRSLGLAVDGWHGDISASRKGKVLASPPAGLVITPESLQGLILNRRDELTAAVQGLRYVVVDEVHAFAGTDRGMQLQSLLSRLEDLAGHRICRIALSATVSNTVLVAGFLRPGAADSVILVRPPGAALNLDAKVFGLRSSPPRFDRKTAQVEDRDAGVHPRDSARGERLEIAKRIDMATRGRKALVFAGSRLGVEEMSILLADSQVTGTTRPERFSAHHGSLSAELRRHAEKSMHTEPDAVTICTSTLELGVDLPNLDLVAQVDTCLSVASLRQRLGRSGRKEGTRPTLRCYCAEMSSPVRVVERLRTSLMQTVASVELIEQGWVEPADLADLGLSTLIHQTLSLLTNTEGMPLQAVFEALCHRGPWRRVSGDVFVRLLRELKERGLVRQDGRKLLRLDEAGQKLVSNRHFLAVFTSTAEYTVRHAGKLLGTLPMSYPLAMGSTVAFGGRMWIVEAVHGGGWVVDVVPHSAGLPPIFLGGTGQVHSRVRQQMRTLYAADSLPDFLDPIALELAQEARQVYTSLGLAERTLVDDGDSTLAALWVGDRQLGTVSRWLALRHPGLRSDMVQIGLTVAASPEEARLVFKDLLANVPTAEELAEQVLGKVVAKFDSYLPVDLLILEHASRAFDVPGAVAALEATLS
jgi:ATP-dependent Lhr-like helicase